MAHIFAGELSMIDQEVLDSVKQLSDAFWVFAEFSIGRNIDWFIIRPANPSTLILTELKRINTPLRGGVNGPWEKHLPTGDWKELPANGSDMNPYWQAVNSANSLADWLWNNQHLYLEADGVRPSGDFRVWPDILLLSPTSVTHRLPLAPPSRYGRWWFNIPEWSRHVEDWTPRNGVPLRQRDVENLANALGLMEIWSGGAAPVRPRHEARPGTGAEAASFVSWLQTLEQRISTLEQELAEMRFHEEQRRMLETPAIITHASGAPEDNCPLPRG